MELTQTCFLAVLYLVLCYHLFFNGGNKVVIEHSSVIIYFFLLSLGKIGLIEKRDFSEKYRTLLILILIYWGFSLLKEFKARNFLALILVPILFQLIFGSAQLLGLLGSSSRFFLITGSMGNPAPFASYIATCIPFAFYANLKTERENRILG